MTFELWSKESRSILAAFGTEEAALAAVLAAAKTHGESYIENLAIIREDSRGRSTPMAEGAELLRRAKAGIHPKPHRVLVRPPT
jgi:hypothetical protein